MYNSLNLKLTIETSYSFMDMLDLVIFKGRRFLPCGILDIHAHQKSMNKYLYLPSRSAHPLHSKMGFIKAELKEYVVTCSSPIDFVRQANLFFKRLQDRGYPPGLLARLFRQVQYRDRSKFLLTTTSNTSQRSPLIFATRYHPVWEGTKEGETLTLTLTQVPQCVKEIVGDFKKPLI
ncbi:unnamed protein product, partial [Discosporangium mesarthrocarpum]